MKLVPDIPAESSVNNWHKWKHVSHWQRSCRIIQKMCLLMFTIVPHTHLCLPATTRAAGAADRVRAGWSGAWLWARASAGGDRGSFGGVGGFGGLASGPLGRGVAWLWGVWRPAAPVVVVCPVYSPPPVITVRITACAAGQCKGVTHACLKVRLRGLKPTGHGTSCGARAHSRAKHGTVTVIVCVVVARPVKGGPTFMVTVGTMFIGTLSTVRAAVRQTNKRWKRQNLDYKRSILFKKTCFMISPLSAFT